MHYGFQNFSDMHLKIDAREKAAGIDEYLKTLPDVSWEFTHLKAGDYLVDNTFLVERKTLPDFLLSIQDGRLFRQVFRMSGESRNGFIILEGIPADIQNTKMKRESIQGAVLYVSVFAGIPVLRSNGLQETVKLMAMASQKLASMKKPMEQAERLFRYKKQYKQVKRSRIQLLQGLPGVGTKRALQILETFGSVRNFLLADTEQISKVKGLGKIMAEKIHRIVNGER